MPLAETAGGEGEERRAALTALRSRFDEWSTTARAVVKKKAHLIRLGLASRRAPEPREKGGAGPAKSSG